MRLPSAQRLLELQEENPALADELIGRLEQRGKSNEVPKYAAGLFGMQRRFYEDPAKRKAALCSRRAGKTHAAMACLLRECERVPGSMAAYVCLARHSARSIAWATLQEMNRQMDLGLKFREKDQQLHCVLPNGSVIWMLGCPDQPSMEKLRGLKLVACVVDEGASFPEWIRDMIEAVIEPTLLDYDGVLLALGTPGVVPAGFFFDITTGRGFGSDISAKWPTYEWRCTQNPYIQTPEDKIAEELVRAESPEYENARVVEWLAKKRRENKWDETQPRYVREWLGKWTDDDTSLVYPLDARRNSYRTLPLSEKWTYAIGVDVGIVDATAIVVGAYRKGHPEMYIVHAEKRSGMIPSTLAARLQVLQEQYRVYEIVMDVGGIGKAFAEECTQRYGIYVTAAEKTKKRAFQEIVAGELQSGNVKIHPQACGVLLDEMAVLQWDETREKEDERFPNHCCDAFLYLVRSLLPTYRPDIERAPKTHKELIDQEMAEHKMRALKAVRARMRKSVRIGEVMHDIAAGR